MFKEEKSENSWNVSLLMPGLALGVACAAALLLVLAGMGSRFGWWHFRTGFALLGYGAYGGIGALLLAVWGGILAGRRRQTAGIVLAAVAFAGGLTVAAVPASWRMSARKLPVIHDITTDTVHPPQFVAVLSLRKGAPNPADYGGPEVAEQQKTAYADLRTEVMNLPTDRAFERALTAAKAAGWRIVAAEPQQGRIEAIDTTFWFGFTDDIVIRTVAAGERTLLDIRSVSRVGKSDVGTNARRIRSYLKRLRELK
jgi:uncharacterized protein (DUF1499 family)